MTEDELVALVMSALDKSERHTFESRARKILNAIRPAIRNAALEEAAEVADAECAENEADDRLDNHMRAETADHIADKIRALKSKEPSHD